MSGLLRVVVGGISDSMPNSVGCSSTASVPAIDDAESGRLPDLVGRVRDELTPDRGAAAGF
jgi:hypothetical protein